MAESSLVVESGQAKHCQAQLTRLQMALGLKKEVALEDLKNYRYGQKLQAISADKPTGYDRKGDTAIVSLDLTAEFQGDKLIRGSAATQKIYTTNFRKRSPKDYTSQAEAVSISRSVVDFEHGSPEYSTPEEWLGCVRNIITKALEPTCLDADGKPYKVQPKDHTSHGLCKSRTMVILLLPEKARCLRIMKKLGFDPYKHIQIVDIVSLCELYQARLVREDYSRRHPMTGSRRTTLTHDWDNLSTAEQVRTVLGYEAPSGELSTARLNLKAAVDLASSDALSPGWLRTLDQIDGGKTPGPWVEKSEVTEYLLNYDAATKDTCGPKELRVRLQTLDGLSSALSQSALVGLTEHLARIHNFTYLLKKDTQEVTRDSLRTPETADSLRSDHVSPKSSSNSASPAPSSTTSTSPSASSQSSSRSTEPPTTVHLPVSASAPALPPLAHDAKLDEETRKYCTHYHRYQEAFEKELSKAPVSSDDKKIYDSLFDWEPYEDHKGRSKITPISCDNYPRVFAILRRTEGWTMSTDMSSNLRSAIFNREQAQKWYQRLPASDRRRSEDNGHENIIKVLKEGEAALLRKDA